MCPDLNVMTGYWRIQETRRPHDAVLQRIAGAEARRLDLHVDARIGERPGDLDPPGPDREAAANRCKPEHVPGPGRDG